MARQKRFAPGQKTSVLHDHEWLNSLETRLNKLENLKGGPGINTLNTAAGLIIALAGRIDNVEIVKLKTQLTAMGTAEANVLSYDKDDKQDEASITDEREITVKDLLGYGSEADLIGLALIAPRGKNKLYFFIPLQYSNFDSSEAQALTHTAATSTLRWVNLTPCP